MARSSLGTLAARLTDHLTRQDVLSKFQQANLPGGFVAGSPGTRRCQFAFGSGGESSWTGTTLDSCTARMPIRLPVSTTRWRLRIANIRPDGTTTPGNINFTGVYIQEAFVNTTTGAMNGWFTTTPLQAAGALVSTGGAEVFTPWVTASNMQISASKAYLISIGFTKAGTTIFSGSGGMYFTASAADVAAVSPGLSVAANVPFDISVEYEYEGTARSYLAIGDSLTEGTGAGFNIASWHQVLSMRTGSPIAMSANFGSASAQWTTLAQRRYQKLLNGGLDIDGAIVAIGSNDANASVALATYQANMVTIIQLLRNGLGIRDIYVCNIAPRSFTAGSAQELRRLDYNAWINAQLPGLGVVGIFDINDALQASYDSIALRPRANASDAIHWSPMGNMWAATAMNLNGIQ